jgi:hypothetical protein
MLNWGEQARHTLPAQQAAKLKQNGACHMVTTDFKIRALHASSLVVISSDWKESKNGLTETTTEEIACIRDGKHYQVHVIWTEKFLKRDISYCILSDNLISEAEYKKARQQHGVEDTAENHSRIKRQAEITIELKSSQPKCPTCNALMVFRHSDYGEFWGCKRYPKCKGKRNPTLAVRKRINSLLKEHGTPYEW